MNISLFGAEAKTLEPLIKSHPSLTLVENPGDVVVCFGGDGTLLAAELKWPNVPKVPIRNSRRGIRCIPGPPEEVIAALANNTLLSTEHLKLECCIDFNDHEKSTRNLLAINEFTVHMGRVNAAVRFKIWFDEKPFGDSDDDEIIGDGFMVSTPFGSTAYFNEITRGTFWTGIGVAFMYAREKTNHVVLPEDVTVRAEITRGPAILAFDNSSQYIELVEGDQLLIHRHTQPAIMLTPKGDFSQG